MYQLCQPVFDWEPSVPYTLDLALKGIERMEWRDNFIGRWQRGEAFPHDKTFVIITADNGALALRTATKKYASVLLGSCCPVPVAHPMPSRTHEVEHGLDFLMDVSKLPCEQPCVAAVKAQPLRADTLPALIVRKILKKQGAPNNSKLKGELAVAFSEAMARIGASQKDSLPLASLRKGLVRSLQSLAVGPFRSACRPSSAACCRCRTWTCRPWLPSAARP